MGYVPVLVILLWTTIAAADEALLSRMELEAQLLRVGRETAEAARLEIAEVAKETSLWKEYLATQEELKTAMAKNKCRPPHANAVPIERRYKELCLGRFRAGHAASTARDAVVRELRDKALALGDDLKAINDKFGWEIYREKMRPRLQELDVEMTEELQLQLRDLYKSSLPGSAGSP